MPEYIEREALMKRLDASPIFGDPNCGFVKYGLLKKGVLDLIERQPAADLVRCYECEHWDSGLCTHRDGLFRSTLGGQFCSTGKRKGEGE